MFLYRETSLGVGEIARCDRETLSVDEEITLSVGHSQPGVGEVKNCPYLVDLPILQQAQRTQLVS
ncbi:hypothetical protein [Sporosarcina sp. BI001-red]|uniref:hypothetical protein n=1 Tax=Sporosarcina sp. BI001-red TaxID=2282866 RepID=UPI0011C032A4|nr:hypothetical protein [Sporosarcina sp. BI001-red]